MARKSHLQWRDVAPHAPFEPNTTYVVGRNVEALGINCRNPLELTFKTGAVEPLPESMGELSIGEIKREVISLDDSDGCLSPAEVVYVDVELALSEDAKRWQGGLFINTQVDGEPHNESQQHRATFKPGETWMGYGRDRVFVICEERRAQGGEQRFQEGSHEIQMVGTIPGTEVQIESNTVTVDLYCNPPAPAEEESGCSAAGGAPFALSLLILGALRRRRRE